MLLAVDSEARGARETEPAELDVAPPTDDRRFLASATAPLDVPAGLEATVRLTPVALVPAVELLGAAEVLLVVLVLLLLAVTGLRAAAAVPAVLEDGETGAVEVRRPALEELVVGRFLDSSSETDGRERWDAVVDAVPGRFTVDVVPVAGLVGALLNVLAVEEDFESELVAAGFAVELDAVPGRRRPLVVVVVVLLVLAGRFAAVVLEDVFFAAGDEGDEASTCEATLGMSVSDMMQSDWSFACERGVSCSVGRKGGVARDVPSYRTQVKCQRLVGPQGTAHSSGGSM